MAQLGDVVTDQSLIDRLNALSGQPAAPGNQSAPGLANPGVVKKGSLPPSPPEPTGSEMLSDAAQSIVPGMVEGAVAIPTAPTSILEIGRQLGANAPDPIGSMFKKIPEVPFTFPKVMGAIEKANADAQNPIHKPTTGAGELTKMASSFIPAMGLGSAENAGMRAVQTFGSALGAAGAGELSKGSKYQPAFEMAGALLGARAAPRAVTPFSRTDPNYARSVGQLENAGVDLTAARKTGSPGLLQYESNLGVNSNEIPSFSRAFLKNIGINSEKASPQELANAQQNFKSSYNGFVNSSNMPYTPDFIKSIKKAGTDYKRVAGASGGTSVEETINDIINGVSGKSPVLSMPGARFQHMKDLIEQRINSAGSYQEKDALIDIKKAMEKQFRDSLPNDRARNAWDQLNREYANWNVVSNAKLPSDGIISPAIAEAAIRSQRGNQAMNLGQGSLAQLTQAGHDVLGDRPPANPKVSETVRSLMSLAGAGAGYRYTGGGESGLVGALLGRDIAGFDLPKMLKGAMTSGPVRKVYENPLVQGYLSNQVLPGNKMGNGELLLRALAGGTPAALPAPSQ